MTKNNSSIKKDLNELKIIEKNILDALDLEMEKIDKNQQDDAIHKEAER